VPFLNPEERRICREVVYKFLATKLDIKTTTVKKTNYLQFLCRDGDMWNTSSTTIGTRFVNFYFGLTWNYNF